MKRANIISFQVFIDSKGTLMTEFASVPLNKTNIFNKTERPYIDKILREATLKLEGLHDYLEKELQAL